MSNFIRHILLIVAVIEFALILLMRDTTTTCDHKTTTDAIHQYKDSIDNIVNSLYWKIDSLQCIIDTSEKVIVNIYKEYEESYINLDSAPIGDQVLFFSNYLSKNN